MSLSEPPSPPPSARELATILAALLYWQEEMCPHGKRIMRPYFQTLKLERFEPLTTEEVRGLMRRLHIALSDG